MSIDHPKPPFPAQKHALRKSLEQSGKGGAAQPAKGRTPKKAASGQRKMLMAISAKGEGKGKPAARFRCVHCRHQESGRLQRSGSGQRHTGNPVHSAAHREVR